LTSEAEDTCVQKPWFSPIDQQLYFIVIINKKFHSIKQIFLYCKVNTFGEGHNIFEISTGDFIDNTWDKPAVEISQNFVAFSEYMNFIEIECWRKNGQGTNSKTTQLQFW
jgi:hypothetical protein